MFCMYCYNSIQKHFVCWWEVCQGFALCNMKFCFLCIISLTVSAIVSTSCFVLVKVKADCRGINLDGPNNADSYATRMNTKAV